MVGRIQEQLEAIYGIRSEARVDDFLVDEQAAEALGWTGRSQEELLVREEDGELEIALFLDRTLLERFRHCDEPGADVPLDEHLDGYCQIAEGVSHFLYLTHMASTERSVSLLELETQAEIDKFASCALQKWDAGPGWAESLLARLFDRVSFLPTLTPPERWRYEEANRLSRNFCQGLLRHVKSRQMDRFLTELRYAYRLGAQAKIRHLAKVG